MGVGSWTLSPSTPADTSVASLSTVTSVVMAA
jgi:hypothetical protein